MVGQRGLHLNGVARLDAVLEAHLIDACIEGQLADEVVFHQQCATLGHNLAEDDTRHNGFAREVALQEEFLARHMVLGVAHMVLVEVHLVDQEHGLAVREILFNFVSIHIVVLLLDFSDR